METISKIEKLFTIFNESAETLSKELEDPYIEGLADTGENFFHQAILQEDLSELSKKKLDQLYRSANLSLYTKEEIRKAFQLAILKGLKEGAHPNHQMTPDTVGIFMGYLVNKFFSDWEGRFVLLDLACGTGNLLTAVLNSLEMEEADSYGIDVDELLIRLAYSNANLQEHPVSFFNQDSLQPLFTEPADAVICDLPVGYYPDDAGAEGYELKADKGHSYAHHLLIEQGVKYAKPGAYLFFVVPNQLFESEEAPKLNKFLKEKVFIQGLLQLPLTMFKSEQHAKSILILQKKGDRAAMPKNALLANLPKFSNKAGMQSVMNQLEDWFKENKQNQV